MHAIGKGEQQLLIFFSREWKLRFDLTLVMVEIWKIANALAPKCELLKEKVFKHGGEIMTSMMMAIAPDLVDMKRARVEYLKSSRPAFVIKSTMGGAEFEGIEINLYEKAKSCTETGIMGNPMGARPETGKWLLSEIESYLERMIRNL